MLSNFTSLPLKDIVSQIMEEYFSTLEDEPAQKLYDMVIKEVEFGLFRSVLVRVNGNKSKAAQWLGLARNTFLKRLSEHGLPLS